MQLSGKNFTFLCCIFEVASPEKPRKYVCCSVCCDGQLRLYEDAEVTIISPAELLASDFWACSKITLIYQESQPIHTGAVSKSKDRPLSRTVGRSSHGHKIMSFPKLQPHDVHLHKRTHKSVGTMTEDFRRLSLSKAIQTDSVPLNSYEECKRQPKFKLWTGITVDDFEALYSLLGGDDIVRRLKMHYNDRTPLKLRKTKFSGKDRLFMFLLRLRRGLPLEELAFMFKSNCTYVSEICYAMTRHLYETFKTMEKEMFASAASQCKGKPEVMKPFHNLKVIIDGASFYIQTPSNFEMQGNTFSRYKSHNVLLFLIGISCTGATIFCSPDCEGGMSDKECVLTSGLLDLLEKGDGVMSDRGMDLKAELQEEGCHFYKPPSLGDRRSLTAEEEILTKALASARIYTEHAIADIKEYRLLQGVMPLTLEPVAWQLVYIAAFLRNFYPSRIHNYKVTAPATNSEDN